MREVLDSAKTTFGFHGKHSWPFRVTYIVVVFIMFSANIHISSGTDEEGWPPARCNVSNILKGSKYVSNLNTALNSLYVDASQSRFNSCEYGQSPDQVYALVQCRGDATVHECNNCSQQAKIDMLKICGTRIGSRDHKKFCFLRFENYNFVGEVDTSGEKLTNDYTVSSNPAVFLAAAQQLLSKLSSDILSGSATDRFASGSTINSSHDPIFALAQCWGDISLPDCKTCLSTTMDKLFTDNPGSLEARALAGSCIVQYGSKPSPNPPPPPSNPPPPPPEKSSTKIPIFIGVPGGLLLLLILCFFVARKRSKYAIFGGRRGGHYMGDNSQNREGEQPTGQLLGTIPRLSNPFTVFKMETLVAATENFHDNNKLGEGGFGTVYKGTSPEGREIAVKKLSLKSMQSKKEFLNEVELLAKIQHRNLVKLLGCCTEGSERLLVYEYLPNNSLDKILFDRNKRRQLDWQKRFTIILGITRGLLYLHEDSHFRIIHRDIKAGNILLDSKLNPKVADFGLARLFEEDETSVMTRIAGTLGYMAPEYAMHGQLSAKADVYSFGILLLELMSGRKNVDFNLSLEMQILVEWVWGLYKRGNIVEMIDPAIIETCSDREQALRCIHVGLLCTQADSSLRPSMATVNSMLSTEAVLLPDPTKPAFVNSVATHGTRNSAAPSPSAHTRLAPPSNADASITELEPR